MCKKSKYAKAIFITLDHILKSMEWILKLKSVKQMMKNLLILK